MKKRILSGLFSILLLIACSAPQQVRTAPLDLKTVEQYNAKVYRGDTVPASRRNQQAEPVEMPLNASDSQAKTGAIQARPRVILAPSIGYGYYRGAYHGYYHPFRYY